MPRLLTDITPLRESAPFRRLFTGSLLSSIGGALTGFAIPLQVYDITRSPFVQAVTTDALRGRLTAAEYVIGAGGESLGKLESGLVGSLASPVISALSGGLITVALSAVLALALPGFARYRAGQAGQSEPTRPSPIGGFAT